MVVGAVVVVVGAVVVVVVDPVPGSSANELVTEAESPSVSVIVRRAKWLPAVVKVLVTVTPVAVVPSLNSHTYGDGPLTIVEVPALKVTV